MVRWSNLPLELVEVIDSKITLYLDKVRFRMVCKSWRSRLPILHQRAWLLHKPYGNTEGMHGLYNPIDDEFYEIELKYGKGKYIKGCSYGWVAIFNDNIPEHNNPARRKVYLMNIFTNAHVSLPSTEIRPRNRRQLEIRKIVLSSPIADKNCIAVALYNTGELSYCRCGDKTWNDLFIDYDETIRDVIFHKDKLLLLDWCGELSVVEEIGERADSKFVASIIFERFSYRTVKGRICFVRTSTGGIIVVHVKTKIPASPQTGDDIELYKIDRKKQAVKIYDIGNNNLFLDSISGIMVPSTNGDQRNRIYVIKDITSRNSDIEKSSLSVFNLDKGSLRVLLHSETTTEVLCHPNIWVTMN